MAAKLDIVHGLITTEALNEYLEMERTAPLPEDLIEHLHNTQRLTEQFNQSDLWRGFLDLNQRLTQSNPSVLFATFNIGSRFGYWLAQRELALKKDIEG